MVRVELAMDTGEAPRLRELVLWGGMVDGVGKHAESALKGVRCVLSSQCSYHVDYRGVSVVLEVCVVVELPGR